jgi:hypothetical protein
MFTDAPYSHRAAYALLFFNLIVAVAAAAPFDYHNYPSVFRFSGFDELLQLRGCNLTMERLQRLLFLGA